MKRLSFLYRVLCLLLCVLLGGSALSGCGAEKGKTDGTPSGAPTVSPTDTPTGEPTEEPTSPHNLTVALSAFTLCGQAAETARQVLLQMGIDAVEAASGTLIIGEDGSALAQDAKRALAAAAHPISAFALRCDGDRLAIAAGSTAAYDAALRYVYDAFVREGALTVPADLSYLSDPSPAVTKLGGLDLARFAVVCADATSKTAFLSVGTKLAERLSYLCGEKIEMTQTAPSADTHTLTFAVANNGSGNKDSKPIADSYTVSLSGNGIRLTGDTRATVSAAAWDFTSRLASGETIHEGDNTFMLCCDEYGADRADLITYCGTWQATDMQNSHAMVSYWNANSFSVSFTGNMLRVDLSVEGTVSFKATLDGKMASLSSSNSTAYYYASGEGVHTLKVSFGNRDAHVTLKGFAVEKGAKIFRPAAAAHYIQFVGDSISDGASAFSQLVGAKLGWDYGVIARSGMALMTGRGYVNYEGNFPAMCRKIGKTVGMEDAFFRLGCPEDRMIGTSLEKAYSTDYLKEDSPVLNRYQTGYFPDIVFLFIGTNDGLSGGFDAAFTKAYSDFVAKILTTYGEDTQICIMNCPSGNERRATIRLTVQKLVETYGDTIHFLDTDLIDAMGVEISADGVHPTVAGHKTLAEGVAAWLQKEFG